MPRASSIIIYPDKNYRAQGRFRPDINFVRLRDTMLSNTTLVKCIKLPLFVDRIVGWVRIHTSRHFKSSRPRGRSDSKHHLEQLHEKELLRDTAIHLKVYDP